MISADEARKRYYGSLVNADTVNYIEHAIKRALGYQENSVTIYNIKKDARDKIIFDIYHSIEHIVGYLKFYGYDVQYKIDNANNSYELIIKW